MASQQPVTRPAALVGSTGIEQVMPTTSQRSRGLAKELRSRAERREHIPVRTVFVRRASSTDPPPPLARIIGQAGPGGEVALKLYLAGVWLCSAEPFDTPPVAARHWAELLDLPEPATLGARRITAAITALETHQLVRVHRAKGEPSTIRLLRESGSGRAYSLPSTAYAKARSDRTRAANRYLRIPTELWTQGHIQSMSGAALAMLIVVLSEGHRDQEPVWWSTTAFPDRFAIGKGVRAKGTRELVSRRLLLVRKKAVTPNGSVFAAERVRNTYRPINEAAID